MIKKIFIGLVALFAAGSAIFGLRLLSGPEDYWSCVNGQWVMHGHPSTELPNEGCGPKTTTVKLYYYNQKLDQGEQHFISCDEKYVVPTERTVTVEDATIEKTLKLLLMGELTDAERSLGLTTEFPNEGFSLTSYKLEDGQLFLEFKDENSFTSGGSCRIGLLRMQIEKTALQFPEVKHVVFPEELFQP